MRRMTIIGLALACALALAATTAGTAGAMCTGANIEGNGASLQAAPQQQYWSPPFNARCAGTEQVRYNATNSGQALESWWVGRNIGQFKGFGNSNAFVGTDQPPSHGDELEILEKATMPGQLVLTIPVAQAALALPIHLPFDCKAQSGKGRKTIKRLALSDAQLEEIYTGAITTWGELDDPANGDELLGEGCNEAPIKRVVREKDAGTTAILKKFLGEIFHGIVAGLGATWDESAEQLPNEQWPGAGLIYTAATGIAATVAATPGSIGYAGLNEVRSDSAFTPAGGGGEGSSIFWPELQSSAAKYTDPSTNGEQNARADANCVSEAYLSLPSSAEQPWNAVTASLVQKRSYALCGLTYDLSLCAYNNFGVPTVTAGGFETVDHYLNYILEAPAQAALAGNDYLGLPSSHHGPANILLTARAGAKRICI